MFLKEIPKMERHKASLSVDQEVKLSAHVLNNKYQTKTHIDYLTKSEIITIKINDFFPNPNHIAHSFDPCFLIKLPK